MKMKQSITFRLDRNLIRRAKVVAAMRETWVSQRLGEKLEEIVRQDEEYERAKRAAFADLDQGFHFRVRRTATREELHER